MFQKGGKILFNQSITNSRENFIIEKFFFCLLLDSKSHYFFTDNYIKFKYDTIMSIKHTLHPNQIKISKQFSNENEEFLDWQHICM